MADGSSFKNEEILGEETKRALRETFGVLDQKVILEVFTKPGTNDEFNEMTMEMVSQLVRLSPKLEARSWTIGDERSRKLDVTRSPTVLLQADRYGIRYTGAPLGEEGRSFIQTIIRVSLKESGLSPQSKAKLAGLKEPRRVQVFVTPTCPYCPGEVLNAFKAVLERPDLVTAEVVEVVENLDLAREFDVGGVPHTMVNGVTVSKGLQPEERFIDNLLSLKRWVEPRAEARVEGAKVQEFDLVVIGGGPAGLTAAIYAERSGLKTIVLEKGVLGGQVAITPFVENWPGFRNIAGVKLMEMIGEQARDYTEIHEGEPVLEVKVGRKIEVLTGRGRYLARGLILAMGAEHRKLGVPGEDRYSGRGVAYCATCDGYLFREREVAVVGGGNSALTDALYLHSLGAMVTLIHRRDRLRAEKHLQEAWAATGRPVLYSTVVKEILGGDRVSSLKILEMATGQERLFKVDGVFISIGLDPQSELAREIGVLSDEQKFIKVDRDARTNIPRIYAAGDITGGVRQIVTAVGAGAVAALSAFEDLENTYWKRMAG